MIDAEQATYNLLKSRSQITAIVGTRIFPVLAAQKTTQPYLTYQIISENRIHQLDGVNDLSQGVMQINCWANSPAAVNNLAKTVMEPYDLTDETGGIDGFQGTVEEAKIQCCWVTDKDDLLEFEPGADKTKKFGKRIDINIWYNMTDQEELSSSSSSEYSSSSSSSEA